MQDAVPSHCSHPSSCLSSTPSTSQGDNIILPLSLSARVISNNQQAICPPDEVRETAKNDTTQDIRNMIRNAILPTLLCRIGQTQANPAASCSEIPTSCSSGYYWVRTYNGSAVQVYCDTQRMCGSSNTTGWTRVATLNTSDPSQQCPGEWVLRNYSSELMLCGRDNSDAGCLSAIYSTYGINYSHVCGRVMGYQYATPSAFSRNFEISPQTIDGYYVDGVSLTHGPHGARQHIWTFAAGLTEMVHSNNYWECPCAGRQTQTIVPSYVGNDYYCESGSNLTSFANILFSSDPLWDGQGCGSSSCCELSYPPGVTAPWFYKQLPQATTNDLEVRICGDESTSNEDTPVELIELYIYWSLPNEPCCWVNMNCSSCSWCNHALTYFEWNIHYRNFHWVKCPQHIFTNLTITFTIGSWKYAHGRWT